MNFELRYLWQSYSGLGFEAKRLLRLLLPADKHPALNIKTFKPTGAPGSRRNKGIFNLWLSYRQFMA
jgi:hypothetical protein